MKIGIDYQGDPGSRQMFDSLYAFKQSQSPETNYRIDLVIDEKTSIGADIRILYSYMPKDLAGKNPADYDFVFLCNNGESLDISTQLMFDLYHKYSNVYMISNSYLHPTHPRYNRTIWYCYSIPNCRDYWNRPFYPQFYEHQVKSKSIRRQNKISVINGQNRAWRHHAIQEILKYCPEIDIRNSITKDNTVSKLLDCFWETPEDTAFKEQLHKLYTVVEPTKTDYYDKSILVGIDQRFGSIPPGFLILDDYYENLITVFSESSWINNELAVTEKVLKCFMAGSIPFPLGGCRINQLYNELGFYTAWNLLPDDLKQFDYIENHMERYSCVGKTVAWLHKNLNNLDQQQINHMADHNRSKFLTGGNGVDLNALCNLLGIS